MSETQNTLPAVPPPTPIPATSAPRILAVLGAVFGGLVLLLSLCGLAAYLLLPLRSPGDALTNNVLLGSGIALGLIFGGLLFSTGLSIVRQRPQMRFSLPPGWLFVSAFFVALGVGQSVLSANLAPAYLFPPWHVLASAMLPLAVLAYAARRLPSVSSSSVVAEFTWGGVGTVLLAAVLELVIVAVLVLVVALVLLLVLGPTGFEQLVTQFRALLSGTRGLGRIDELMRLVMQQPVLLITVGVAAVALLSVFVPLVEETIKSLGPAIAIGATKPTLTRALLWGLAAGAGYAFSENLFNGAVGIDPRGGAATLWAVPMMLRGGTSFVHIATTATVSLGWYMALVRGQRARFLLYFVAALAAHGFWNFVSVILGAAVTGTGLGGTEPAGLGTLFALIEVLVLVILVIVALLWIFWLVNWARRQETSSRIPGGEELPAARTP